MPWEILSKMKKEECALKLIEKKVHSALQVPLAISKGVNGEKVVREVHRHIRKAHMYTNVITYL